MSSAVTSPNLPFVPASSDPRSGEASGSQGGNATHGVNGAANTAAVPGQTDTATRDALPAQRYGVVDNVIPASEVYGALAPKFKAAGGTPLTDVEMKAVSHHADNDPGTQKLVGQLYASTATGSSTPAPTRDQYEKTQQQFVANLFTKTGSSEDDDKTAAIIANIKNPQMLIQYVFMAAASEMQKGKQMDLENLQRFSTISDLLTNEMNSKLVPAQQKLQTDIAGGKSSDSYKKTVAVDALENPSIDQYQTVDGKPALVEAGTPKTGASTAAAPAGGQMMTQTQLASLITARQNSMQQATQRMQKEQTAYSGHDSQYSTLIQTITSTNSIFKDGTNSIVRNIS